MAFGGNDNFGDYFDACVALGACEESVAYCNQFRDLTLADFIRDHFLVDPEVPDHWAGWVICEGPDITNPVRTGFREKLRDSYWTIFYTAKYPAKFSAAERQYAKDMLSDLVTTDGNQHLARRVLEAVWEHLTVAQRHTIKSYVQGRYPNWERDVNDG